MGDSPPDEPPEPAGQALLLRICVTKPSQGLPSFLGAGLVQVLDCVPPPQALEQALKALHPPCTAVRVGYGHESWREVTRSSMKQCYIKIRTGTDGLRVARFGLIAFTLLAAMLSVRVVAFSRLNSCVTTSFRATAEECGPPAVHCKCDAADGCVNTYKHEFLARSSAN